MKAKWGKILWHMPWIWNIRELGRRHLERVILWVNKLLMLQQKINKQTKIHQISNFRRDFRKYWQVVAYMTDSISQMQWSQRWLQLTRVFKMQKKMSKEKCRLGEFLGYPNFGTKFMFDTMHWKELMICAEHTSSHFVPHLRELSPII